MSKNTTRKGLALGAAVALVTAGVVSAPAAATAGAAMPTSEVSASADPETRANPLRVRFLDMYVSFFLGLPITS